MDFTTMTDEELTQHRNAIERILSERQTAARNAAIEQVRKLILQYELTPTSVGFPKQGGATKPPREVAVRFRGPNGETWAGRGRTPRWLEALEAEGRQRTEFAV